jgi:5'-3' exonuclease
MGIDKFFNNITKKSILNATKHDLTHEPMLSKDMQINNSEKGEFSGTLIDGIDTNHLYIDFNSVMYTIYSNIEHELNYILFKIIYDEEYIEDDEFIKYANIWKINTDKLIEILTLSDDLINQTNNRINYIKSIITNEIVTESLKQRILNYINMIVTELNNKKLIEQIFISIDGTPNMAKIVEQKSRRYVGQIVTKLKKDIYEKYSETFDLKRQQFEHNKFGSGIAFSKSKITPWSTLMNDVYEILCGDEFKVQIYDKCQNLKEYFVSGPNDNGEGEKKIMENIYENKAVNKKITIYSPDSDLIILLLIAKGDHASNGFNIIRYNQQDGKHDYVLVDILSNKMFETIKKDSLKNDLIEHKVVNDICLIYTLFGNDFLPKIESLNTYNIIDLLLTLYAKHISTNSYIIDYPNKKLCKRIQFSQLFNMIKLLHEYEELLLRDNYKNATYINYFYLRKYVFDDDMENFDTRFNSFIEFRTKLDKRIKKISTFYNKADELTKNKTISKLFKFGEKNKDFVKLLPKLITIKNVETNCDNFTNKKIFLNNYIKARLDDFICMDSSGSSNIRFNGELKEKKLENENITKANMIELKKKYLFNETINVAQYDIEMYKLDHMLGSYRNLLHATDNIELGKVTIDKTTNQIVKEPIEYGMERYYTSFFNSNDSMVLDKISYEYISGLIWVFDFYFNKNDKKYNHDNVSEWYHKEYKAPLLKQLYKFLETDIKNNFKKCKNIMGQLKRKIIKREDFMNKLEHYLYINPPNVINHTENLKVYTENNYFYKDINEIHNNITENVDCRGIYYLNKCHILIPTIDFKPFIAYVRKIQLST